MKAIKILPYIAAFALLIFVGVWINARGDDAPESTATPQMFAPEPTPAVEPTPAPTPTPDGGEIRILFTASEVDFDADGTDDYTDIFMGARAEAERHPEYDERYWPDMGWHGLEDAQMEGYPPDEYGVCTDLVWRAFRDAGYDLKAMIDADIRLAPDEYELAGAKFDSNIDFRLAEVQDLFFSRYAVSLTIDADDPYAWQAGDIAVYDGHIGIASGLRREDGLPYLIHNTDALLTGNMEEDALDSREILAHYRWDASLIPDEILKAW